MDTLDSLLKHVLVLIQVAQDGGEEVGVEEVCHLVCPGTYLCSQNCVYGPGLPNAHLFLAVF
jgi:hypothetical protein